MKCPKCGAELSEDTKFCSYCGQKIEEEATISEDEKVSPEASAEENFKSNVDFVPNKDLFSQQATKKGINLWNKLSAFEKVSAVSITVFVLTCITAFLCGKILAGIIAILQVALIVIAILMKKQIINAPKSWLNIVAVALAFALAVPFVSCFNIKKAEGEKFTWSDIVLSEVIPEPKSHMGDIISNSSETLSMYVYSTSESDYDSYVDACKEKGFTADAEQLADSFQAYNESGYKLELYFADSDKEMHIDVDAPMKLGTLKWSESEYGKLLPIPKSTVGKIEKDDKTGFEAYVGETSIEDYDAYVTACAEKGFTFDSSKTDKHYAAKNENSYKITVDYQGNNIMCISIYEPEYEVSIEVECVENWIFSKYDVDVYVDDSSEGTLNHGGTDKYDVTLKKGTHTIKFVNAEDDEVTGTVKVDVSKNDTFKFKISCTSSKIDVETISGKTEDTSSDSNTTSSEENNSPTETTSEVASETESPKPLFYSTNDYDTAKKGNTGVFSYKNSGNSYDIYWIIDFDNGYVYYFTEGNGESTCDRLKIDSGDLNDKIIITYHDGSDVWSYGLHFKYVNHPETLIMQDNDGFEYKYSTTDLSKALSLRSSKTIKDY